MDALPQILASSNQRVYCNGAKPTLLRPKLYELPASQPEYGAWANTVQFQIIVVGVGADNGSGGAAAAPTVHSLGVKFQVEIAHTEFEQYLAPKWSDLDTSGMTKIIEGSPWGTVKSHNATLEPSEGDFGIIAKNGAMPTKAVIRTLQNFGRDCRIVLDPFAEGEEATRKPYYNVVVLAIAAS